MKVNLFTTYYTDDKRQIELNRVAEKNLYNSAIDQIFILSEVDLYGTGCRKCTEVIPEKNKIIHKVKIAERPTFDSIFKWVNEVTGDDDINIIANSDICFDTDAVSLMETFLKHNECWALTRWDYNSDNVVRRGSYMLPDATFMNRNDSQDVWVFKGVVRCEAEFCIGVPGCDNRLAYEIQKAGYVVTNPSWSVKCFHLHKGSDRNWHGMEQVPGPYLLLDPCTL